MNNSHDLDGLIDEINFLVNRSAKNKAKIAQQLDSTISDLDQLICMIQAHINEE